MVFKTVIGFLMKRLSDIRINLCLTLVISTLIHLVLVAVLFTINTTAVNKTAIGQRKPTQAQRIAINLHAVSTADQEVKSQSKPTKATKQQSTQSTNTATPEPAPPPIAKAGPRLLEPKLPKEGSYTGEKQQLTKKSLTKGSHAAKASIHLHTSSTAETLDAAALSASSAQEPAYKAKSSKARMITNPIYRKWKKPVYPHRSIVKKQEGKVLVDVHVDKEGQVIAIAMYASSGYPLLDRSAIKSVKRWVFEPARRNGVAVESTVRVPVNFTIAQQ